MVGLKPGPVTALAEDGAGNLWAAQRGSGIARIARSGLITFTHEDGLAADRVVSIFEDRAGELCVLTRSPEGIFINRFDGQRFHAVQPNVPPRLKHWGWGGNQLDFEDSSGDWWIATAEGMYEFSKVFSIEQLGRVAPRAVYNLRNGLAGNSVYRAFEDSRGDIWISTDGDPVNGLTRIDRKTGRLERYGEADHVSPRALVTAFQEDRSGNLWIGAPDSLIRYRDGLFQAFGVREGLPPGWVSALYLDHGGRLWATSNVSGLVLVDFATRSCDRLRR